jgi:hypothetical protein
MRRRLSLCITVCTWLVCVMLGVSIYSQSHYITHAAPAQAPQATTFVFLPIISRQTSMQPMPTAPRVNVPYFNGTIPFPETAIFWFGRVTPTENYADVRVGYNNTELYVNVTVFDKRLWYDTTPSSTDLTRWDAVTLYVNTSGNTGNVPATTSYRFQGQLNWWESRTAYQAAYRGNGSTWVPTAITFTTTTGWRGNAPNDNVDDSGWTITFHIPFSSVETTSPPPSQTIWGIALTLHDCDDSTCTPITDKYWPTAASPTTPASWGQAAFGLPTYTSPPIAPTGVVTLRHGLDGIIVTDAAVGGGTTCGDGLDYWTQWGYANYAGSPDFNIQNQSDVADWPCFSKYYVTFPLSAIPPGKTIISATLTLYQFGNAGGSGQAQPSLIQVLTVNDPWNESTLNWNNAPLALENVSRVWVDPLTTFPGWPGVPRTWDLSYAVAQAYAANKPLYLALYSADNNYHSGKYFTSSDTEAWNAVGRPTLVIRWGN